MENLINSYFSRIQEDELRKIIDESIRTSVGCLKRGHTGGAGEECPICREFFSLYPGAPAPVSSAAMPPEPAPSVSVNTADSSSSNVQPNFFPQGCNCLGCSFGPVREQESAIPVSRASNSLSLHPDDMTKIREFDARMDRKWSKQLTRYNKGKGKYKNLSPEEAVFRFNEKTQAKRSKFIRKLYVERNIIA